MTETDSVDAQALTAKSAALPPTVRLPKAIQGLTFTLSRRWTITRAVRRHGRIVTLNVPLFGRLVVVADPQLAKDLFTANPDDSATSSRISAGCSDPVRCSPSTEPSTASAGDC